MRLLLCDAFITRFPDKGTWDQSVLGADKAGYNVCTGRIFLPESVWELPESTWLPVR
jgi:hypothetical protein